MARSLMQSPSAAAPAGGRRVWLAAGMATILAGCAIAGGDSGRLATTPNEPPVDLGGLGGDPLAGAPDPAGRSSVLVGLAVKGSDPVAIGAVEQLAEAEVGIVRVFARWDTIFPSANHRALLANGRPIHLSVRPRTDDGRVVPWADIAEAEPGSTTYDELNRWLEIVASYGSQIYFTLNHEPETNDSAANGDSAEFVAAWRKMVGMLRSAGGGDVRTVLVLGRGAYRDGSIDNWYPGDDVVDVVGVDPYNWYRCQGSDRAWTGPRELLEPALAFAAAHGKPLAVPEIASTEHPDDSKRKADWIRELGDVLADPAVAEQLEFLIWFSVHDRAWPDCQWEYDSSPQSTAAMADLLRWYSPPD